MLSVANACGIDTGALQREIGMERGLLDVPESLVSLEQYYYLTSMISSRTPEPDIGLFIGRMSFLENMHLNIYMASASKTLKDWLNMMPSVTALFGDIGQIRVRTSSDAFSLQWVPERSPDPTRCSITDSLICATVLQMDSYCLLPVRPLRVDLSYEKPHKLENLRQMLGDNLHFNQKVSAIHYDRKALSYPQAHVSARIYSGVAEEFAKMFSRDSSQSDPFSLALYAAIRAELPKGECSIEQISSKLAISRRTLQRRLSERETNFQQLVQGIKSTLAKRYLRDDQLSIIQIALLLGYGDHSTFSAAFKTWNGMSPSEYRQGA